MTRTQGGNILKNYHDGGEAILEAFRNLGIDYIMSSPGSEWSSVWEALARQKTGNRPGPTYFDLWHETTAVDMAIGYTQITGRMQAVLLHAGAGLLQGAMAIQAAQQTEVPMLVMSGESLGFGDDPDFEPGQQWYRSLSVVGGPQRLIEPVVKHASMTTSPWSLYETIVRVGELAQRQPCGPVYLNVPIEHMVHEWKPPETLRQVPPAPKTQPVPADIEALAERLAKAANPVIEAQSAGRDPAAVAALVELAELLGAPVVEGSSTTHANFPKDHPLHQGTNFAPIVKDADVVILVASRNPWYPPRNRPPGAFIVSIGENPIKGHWVYQHLHADQYLEADIATTLALVVAALKARGITEETFRARRESRAQAHDAMQAALRAAEATKMALRPVDPLALIATMNDVMPPDAIYVDETIVHSSMVRQHLAWNQPQSYFYVYGGLGQGIGVALGVKLAAPQRPVVLLIGDGTLLYNPIIQGFGASRDCALPILIIVFNNKKYQAMQNNHDRYYPDGVAATNKLYHGVAINGPDYDKLGIHFDFAGEKVDDPAQLKPALEKALAEVQAGRTAIVNVILNR
jgi:acetolactate synthase I/II/III large subunit